MIATDRCPLVTNLQTAQAEGVLGLYKGFVPTFLRLGTLNPSHFLPATFLPSSAGV